MLKGGHSKPKKHRNVCKIMKRCVMCGEKTKAKTVVCPTCAQAANAKKSFFAKKAERKESTPRAKAYCKSCGGRVDNKAIVCPNCNRFSIGKKTLKNPNDKIDLGLCLVAFLVPLFGLIYWPLKHEDVPEKAQAVGIMAVISAVLYMALMYGIINLRFYF